ncbi:UNVERIFIED_CONTAM: hypothetical protein Slati_2685200 [Sesamum latifolium]|uniref:Uncharacterized protein n=1 Tax=Sesamum latifolium TaxID=2727402 RepID=A0AAW2VUU0_9LAMI
MPTTRRRRDPYAIRLVQRHEGILIGHIPILQRSPIMLDLDLCMDGFATHGQYVRTYFYWPVILIPYNLLLGMCMSSEYMFLTMVIPGPSNPKYPIDVYLVPLIEKMQNLWHVGVLMRDSAKSETFTMHAALIWIMNDLPAYGMVSGWSTAGVMGCPVCMEDTHAFYLQNGWEAAFRLPPPPVTVESSAAPQTPPDAGPSGVAPATEEVPPEHQHLWFESMKMTYWWDYNDESMFWVFNMWARKYIRKTFSVAWSSLMKPLWLANDV